MNYFKQLKHYAFVLILGIAVFSCKSDDDNSNPEDLITFSPANLEGTWVISEAVLNVWQEGEGITETIDPDLTMEDQMVTFTATHIQVQDEEGMMSMPYTVNPTDSSLVVWIEDDKTDDYSVLSFSADQFEMRNPNPDASDYNYDEEIDANIYEQRQLTFIKA